MANPRARCRRPWPRSGALRRRSDRVGLVGGFLAAKVIRRHRQTMVMAVARHGCRHRPGRRGRDHETFAQSGAHIRRRRLYMAVPRHAADLQLLLWFNLALVFPTIGIPACGRRVRSDVMTPFLSALLGVDRPALPARITSDV